MRIEHVAIWVRDLEGMRAFYEQFFHARAGAKYTNPKTGFESYFLTFEQGARLELMRRDGIPSLHEAGADHLGIVHLAMTVGTRSSVDALTRRIAEKGFSVVSGPRVTGDGYYESVILDPEGNRIEIVASESVTRQPA